MLIGHFPQKSHIFDSPFAKRDLQLKLSYASLPPCMPPPTYICVFMAHVANTHTRQWFEEGPDKDARDLFICIRCTAPSTFINMAHLFIIMAHVIPAHTHTHTHAHTSQWFEE